MSPGSMSPGAPSACVVDSERVAPSRTDARRQPEWLDDLQDAFQPPGSLAEWNASLPWDGAEVLVEAVLLEGDLQRGRLAELAAVRHLEDDRSDFDRVRRQLVGELAGVRTDLNFDNGRLRDGPLGARRQRERKRDTCR